MRPLLKQIAELVGNALREFRASIEPRLKTLEERDPTKLLADLQSDLAKANASLEQGTRSVVEITMDTKALQKTLDETIVDLRKWFDDAQDKALKGLEDRVKSFDEAARIREGALNEMSGQLRALLEERAGQPALEEVVREVANSLREVDRTLIDRSKEAATAVVNEWRSGIEGQLTALSEALSTVALETLAKNAAALVPMPELKGFVTFGDVDKLIAKHLDLVKEVVALKEALGKTPSVEALASAAAALVPKPEIPDAPDLKGFATLTQLEALTEKASALSTQLAELKTCFTKQPSTEDLARTAAAMVQIPVPQDLTGFATQVALSGVVEANTKLSSQVTELHKLVVGQPSSVDLARAAAALVPVAAPQDLSGFITIEKVQQMIAEDRKANFVEPVSVEVLAREVIKLLPSTPSTEDIARAAAALVQVPALPDLTDFVRTQQLGELHADRQQLNEKMHALNAALNDVPQLEAVKEAVLSALPAPLSVEEVARAASALLPVPKDGASVSVAEVYEVMKPELDVIVDQWRDAMRESCREMISGGLSEITKAIAAIPEVKDGKSFTLEEVQALVVEATKGLVMPTAQEVAESLEGSHLSKWALDFERRAQDLLQRCVDRIQPPKDGVDGLGFEDLKVEYDGVRTFTFVMVKDARRKEFGFKVPVMIHRGVYNDSMAYDKGDVTTWGGSSWLALKDFPEGKPGVGTSHDWQLIVKKGRDGNPK